MGHYCRLVSLGGVNQRVGRWFKTYCFSILSHSSERAEMEDVGLELVFLIWVMFSNICVSLFRFLEMRFSQKLMNVYSLSLLYPYIPVHRRIRQVR